MKALVAAVLGAGFLVVSIPVLLGLAMAHPPDEEASALALADIPAEDLPILMEAAVACPGLSWTVLAGIAKEESDFGRSSLPGVKSGSNPSGAQGPFQFLPSTWAHYGQGNVYDFRDAAFAAARLLCAAGAADRNSLPLAIYAFNHDWGYVTRVLAWAARYAAAAAQGIRDALRGPVGTIRVLGSTAPLFPWVPPGGFPDRFPPGQCTWYAAFQHRVWWNGNAGEWWDAARAAGAAESAVPTLGAIAVWAGPGYSTFGHVGVVVATEGSTFTVAEMNYLGEGVVDERVASLSDPSLLGFIV